MTRFTAEEFEPKNNPPHSTTAKTGTTPPGAGGAPGTATGGGGGRNKAFFARVNERFADFDTWLPQMFPGETAGEGQTALGVVVGCIDDLSNAPDDASDATTMKAALLLCKHANIDPATLGYVAPTSPPSGGGNGAAPGSSAGGTAGGPGVPTDWPEMGKAAYYGLVGDVVRTLLPQTEADPVALLAQYLVYFGNAVGRGPYYLVESSKHFTNLFALMVGATAKARKGLSADRVRSIYREADEAWEGSCIRGGLSSGEGVIHAIRDPIFALRKGVMTQIDPGIDDKRLMLDEREFYSALEVMKREGNIVSRIVRDAWDGRPVLETLTKNTHTRSTGGFVSIAGHITLDEYRAKLDHTSMSNGYANRFQNFCVRRSKMLPFGGDPVDETELKERTKAALDSARVIERVAMTDAAMELWVDVYPQLSRDVMGLLGSLTARAEAQSVRISMIYALIDGKDQIDRVHLEAGLAVWAYCEASTRFIFGDMTGDTVADAILSDLINAGATGRTRTELHAMFGNHRGGGDIGRALALLVKQNRARSVTTPQPAGKRGRPTETWFAI